MNCTVDEIIGAVFIALLLSLTLGVTGYEQGRAWWLKRYGPVPLGFEKKYAEFRAQPLFPMKDNSRYIIIGLAIIIAVSIHACSTRYYSIGNQNVLDRWTGQVQEH